MFLGYFDKFLSINESYNLYKKQFNYIPLIIEKMYTEAFI